MDIVAVLVPTAFGLNVTTNVVLEPAATVALGAVVTVNSEAFVPDRVIVPIVNTLLPVFWIVKVFRSVPELASTEPKSVQSVGLGVMSPSAIDVAFP